MSDRDDYTDLDYWLQNHRWVWAALGWLVGIVWTAAIIAGVIWQLAY